MSEDFEAEVYQCDEDEAGELRITDFRGPRAMAILARVMAAVDGLLIRDAVELLTRAKGEVLHRAGTRSDSESFRRLEEHGGLRAYLEFLEDEHRAGLH